MLHYKGASLYVLFNVWSNLEIYLSVAILKKRVLLLNIPNKSDAGTIFQVSDMTHMPRVCFNFPHYICPAIN